MLVRDVKVVVQYLFPFIPWCRQSKKKKVMAFFCRITSKMDVLSHSIHQQCQTCSRSPRTRVVQQRIITFWLLSRPRTLILLCKPVFYFFFLKNWDVKVLVRWYFSVCQCFGTIKMSLLYTFTLGFLCVDTQYKSGKAGLQPGI